MGLPGLATKTMLGELPAKRTGSSSPSVHSNETGSCPFMRANMPAAGHPGSRKRMRVGATARMSASSTPVPPAPVVTLSGETASLSATASASLSA